MKVRIAGSSGLSAARLITGAGTVAIYDDDNAPLLLVVKIPDKGVLYYDNADDINSALDSMGITLSDLQPIPVTKI